MIKTLIKLIRQTLNKLTVINASAAVTLLEQRPEKNSGSERDLNLRPLRCRCSALPTELSKPPPLPSPYKGLTHIRPLSCGFDSSVGRALHRHRRGRGFEYRSEPEFFSGLCSSSVTAALALMTVITQLLLWRDKLLSLKKLSSLFKRATSTKKQIYQGNKIPNK